MERPKIEPVADVAPDLVLSPISHDRLLEFTRTDRPKFIAHLSSLTPSLQYQTLTSIAEKALQVNTLKNELGDFLETTAHEYSLQGFMGQDRDTWDKMKEFASEYRKERDRKTAAISKIKQLWAQENIDDDFDQLTQRNVGGNTWKALQALSHAAVAQRVSYRDMKLHILASQQDRLGHRTGKVGTSGRLSIEAQDITAATKRIKDNQAVDAPSLLRQVTQHGFGVSRQGFVTDRKAGDDVGFAAVYDTTAVTAQSDPNSELSDVSEGAIRSLLDAEVATATVRRPGLRIRPSRLEELDEDDIHMNDDEFADQIDDRADAIDDIARRGGEDFDDGCDSEYYADVHSLASGDANSEDEDADADEDEDRDLSTVSGSQDEPVAGGKRRRTAQAGRRRKRGKRQRSCGCGARVPLGFLTQLKKGMNINVAAQSKLIKAWFRHKDEHICNRHTILIHTALGMKNHGVKYPELNERLRQYHDATLNSAVGAMKTDLATYQWFRKANRPTRPADNLGPYKYLHDEHAQKIHVTLAHQQEICRYLGIDWHEWDRVGSINVDCFQWWATLTPRLDAHAPGGLPSPTILQVARDEFDMYRHHLREINGRPNFGWLRTMFHSLVQQAMRQDPLYYMMYVALREDCQVNLVSYPYYAKFQQAGDSTYFRHIDVNIPSLNTASRGKFIIQGSVSLDDEYDDDCTEIVPGMHKHFSDWAQALSDRGVKLARPIHAIHEIQFSQEDRDKYGTDWTSVPCRALQVRITQPHLPHGAKGPARRIRRTMLPWFVALQDDHETLEVTESGTFSELSAAHRDLTSGPSSPSGWTNRYGDIPYAFPAAMKLGGLSALSDSLVAQLRPNNPAVVKEKRILLFGTDRQRDAYIDAWRQRCVDAISALWQQVQDAEMDAFGTRSYWYRQRHGIEGDLPPYDPDPSGHDRELFEDGIETEAARLLQTRRSGESGEEGSE